MKIKKTFLYGISIFALILTCTPLTFLLLNDGFNAKGEKGDKGNDGHNGQNGKDGVNGIDGEDGKDGKDGCSQSSYYGEGIPNNALGNDGDTYQNISNGDYYVKKDGSFEKIASIKGDKGDPGKTGFDGEFYPESSLTALENSIISAEHGDIYISNIYGKKGDKVEITFIPDFGYKLSSFDVTNDILTMYPESNYEQGTYKYEATMGESGLIISAEFSDLDLTFRFNNESSAFNKVYDGNELEFNEIKLGNDVITDYTYSWTKYNESNDSYENISYLPKDAGTYKLSITYLNSTKTKEFIYTINKKEITIDELTVNSKVYDGTIDAYIDDINNYDHSDNIDIIEGESFSISSIKATYIDEDVSDDKLVKITNAQVNGNNGTKVSNYDIKYGTTNGSISQLDINDTSDIQVKIDENYSNYNKTYDGKIISSPIIYYKGIPLTEGKDYNITYYNSNGDTINQSDVKNAGSYSGKIEASTSNLTGSFDFTYEIKKKPITIKDLNVEDKTYDGEVTASIIKDNNYTTDLAENESFTIESINGTFDNANAGNDKTVTIPNNIVITGNGDTLTSNYEISYGTTKGNILAEDLSNETSIYLDGVIDNSSKTYDGDEVKVTVKKGNTVVNSSDYTLNYSSIKNAGTYNIVATFKNNYKGSISTNYVINKKDLTITKTISKSYDNKTSATVSDITNYETGVKEEKLNIKNISAYFDSAEKGTNKKVTVKSADVSGVDNARSSNYNIVYSFTGNIYYDDPFIIFDHSNSLSISDYTYTAYIKEPGQSSWTTKTINDYKNTGLVKSSQKNVYQGFQRGLYLKVGTQIYFKLPKVDYNPYGACAYVKYHTQAKFSSGSQPYLPDDRGKTYILKNEHDFNIYEKEVAGVMSTQADPKNKYADCLDYFTTSTFTIEESYDPCYDYTTTPGTAWLDHPGLIRVVIRKTLYGV